MKVLEEPQEFKPVTIVLETPQEVNDLFTLLGAIGGGPKNSVRETTNNLYTILTPFAKGPNKSRLKELYLDNK